MRLRSLLPALASILVACVAISAPAAARVFPDRIAIQACHFTDHLAALSADMDAIAVREGRAAHIVVQPDDMTFAKINRTALVSGWSAWGSARLNGPLAGSTA